MEAKLKTATCMRCKRRKIRCDGQAPCKTCDKMQANCEYDEGRSGGRFPAELKRGAACIPCRRKKKRCDGKLPCSTCLASRSKNTRCEFAEGEVHDGPPETAGQSSGSSSDSPPYPPTPEDVITTGLRDPSPFVMLPDLPEYVVWSDLAQARDLFLNRTEKNGFVVPDKPDDLPTAAPAPAPPKDSLYDISVAHGPALPEPEPGDELGEIRKLFIAHHTQLGLSVSDRLLAAIAIGDSDEDELHPVLLHACQLLGYMLARHRPVPHNGSWLVLPGQSEREAEQTHAALAALHDTNRAPCPFAYLQTSALLSVYFFNKGDIVRAREMVAHAGKLIREHGLSSYTYCETETERGTKPGFRLTPVSRAADATAAISQIVYLDLSYAIMLNLPTLLDQQLQDKFRALVHTPNPDAEVNFVRAKSIFLFYEAKTLVEQWAHPDLADASKEAWQASYWELMDALDAHKSFITLTLTRAAFCPELLVLALTLRVAEVLTLTGISTLLSVFERDNKELMLKKHSTIAEIIQVSSMFEEEDCVYLDPILSACWFSVMVTLKYCAWAEETQPEKCPKSASLYDAGRMAKILRTQNATLKRVLPFALEI
ncbi:hypothetical protein C8F01DRAFT_1165103 [Mycena amicta]|nr:hypothetical protein C8F01DRAFT_1165103 [Mycena amicta]